MESATTGDLWRPKHEAAVKQARAGDLHNAEQILSELLRQHPTDIYLHFDLAVVRAWQGKDAATTALLEAYDASIIPTYALIPYAKATRNLRRFDQAHILYNELIRREPDKFDHQLGKILLHSDTDQFMRAQILLEHIDIGALTQNDKASWQLACGYVFERQRHFSEALACYTRGLQIQPTNRELVKRRIVVTNAMGASNVALQALEKYPDILNPVDKTQVTMDALAMQIRWAEQQTASDRSHILTQTLAELVKISPQSDKQKRALVQDQIVVLTALYRMQEAIDLAGSLSGENYQTLPIYVLNALGRAHLYLNQPLQAVQRYETALAKLPSDATKNQRLNLQASLFFGLSDLQDFAAVDVLISDLQDLDVPWNHPLAQTWEENPRFAKAVHLEILSLAYSEQYDEAITRLDTLLTIAPANANLRNTRALVNRWRGWHTSSLVDLDRIDNSDFATTPSLSTTVQRANLKMDQQAYTDAEVLFNRSLTLDDKEKSVVNLGKRWHYHNRTHLEINAFAGQSDGSQIGSDTYGIDSRIYSPPVAYNYRYFVRDLYRYAEFTEGAARDHRLGVGLEYRQKKLSLSAQVMTSLEEFDGTSVIVQGNWQHSDYWRHSISASYNSVDSPLRGILAGLSSDELTYNLRYRWHESKSANFRMGLGDFEDGNRRESASISYQQRVVNLPRQKISVTGDIYQSRNSLNQASYFNPESDSDISISAIHEWRIHSQHEKSLTQRFTIGIGQYHQDNFGSAGRWQLNLEHEWHFAPALSLVYGLSFARRPYDGQQERQQSVYLSVRTPL